MRIAVAFILFFLSACKPDIPKDVLPPNKMQPVLWDIMVADEMAEHHAATDTSFTRLLKHARYYQSIFRIHNTNEETFKKSMRFYMENPALFKPILDSINLVGERLQQRIDTTQKTIDTFIKTNPRILDSVKKRPAVN